MGENMARRLLHAGAELYVFTRTKAKAEKLCKEGAIWKDSPKEIAENTELIFTIVSYPSDVEMLYFGAGGLLETAKAGTILIDMTTSSPTLAKRIFEEAEKRGLEAMDAPVSGGDIGAKNGSLSIMCGGKESTFEKLIVFFKELGKTFTFMGAAGSGQNTKAANQILVAANLFGTVEALRYAEVLDLDTQKLMQAISSGAAGSWQLDHNGKKILERDFTAGFFVKHFVKDLNIALEVARSEMLNLPMLELARNTFELVSEKGFSDAGTQVLYEYYKQYL